MTYFELLRQSAKLLKEKSLDPHVASYLLQRRLRWSTTKLLMNNRTVVPEKRLCRFKEDLNRYINGEPPQYIIGTAPFYGYNFLVDRHVLIPRPETEELVDWVLKDHNARPIHVLDVGTGSGAIAISLKLQRPRWHVMATDISGAALKVARKNAHLHHVKISFQKSDLFKSVPKRNFDVIVSNPPYVASDEIKYMDADVLNFEPHLALFAKHHGLQMYQRMARSFYHYVKSPGMLYLEMGFRQKTAVKKIFQYLDPEIQIKIRKDMEGHFRMVRIYWNPKRNSFNNDNP